MAEGTRSSEYKFYRKEFSGVCWDLQQLIYLLILVIDLKSGFFQVEKIMQVKNASTEL